MSKQFDYSIFDLQIIGIDTSHKYGTKIVFTAGFETFIHHSVAKKRTDGAVDINGVTFQVGDNVKITKHCNKTVFEFEKE